MMQHLCEATKICVVIPEEKWIFAQKCLALATSGKCFLYPIRCVNDVECEIKDCKDATWEKNKY